MTQRLEVPPILAELLADEPVPQGSFPWRRDPWRLQMHDLPEVLATLDRLPDRVDRESTRGIVLSELDAGRVLSAFVSAMVWGYGTTGVGPLRTRWIFAGVKSREAGQEPVLSSVGERLEAGMQTVRNDGPVEAFRLMNNDGSIKHLRSSYFTKWLYFTSALQGPDDPAAAPIFDDRVSDWLLDQAGVSLNRNRTASYVKYLDLLTEWGEEYGRSRVQVEKTIFGLATGRG